MDDISQERVKYQSMLYCWARLSGIGATISEYRQSEILSPMDGTALELSLINWFSMAGDCCSQESTQAELDLPFCLRPLWHQTLIALFANLSILEHAVGRDGTQPSARSLEYIEGWIKSRESQRCLLHSLCIQNLAGSETFNTPAAIHTPRVLFAAALCWQCYIIYSRVFSNNLDIFETVDEMTGYLMGLPEFQALREDKSHSAFHPKIVQEAILQLGKILKSPAHEMKASTLCVLEGYLRQRTTSGISGRFADIVQAFILGAR